MATDQHTLIANLAKGDTKALARAITIVENELAGYEELLLGLTTKSYIPIIGIPGPPGAGKSTLVNSLIRVLLERSKPDSKGIGIISVDPSSPIHQGAILGDRLRMNEHFNDARVFIRSLATRGALGGLSAKTIEITEVMRSYGFEYILVETVGVGQSEVEIAGLADVTLLVITPESGDDIQVMKSGITEIADIFVVNKADRDGADEFAKNLNLTLPIKYDAHEVKVDVVKTIATQNEGIELLADKIANQLAHHSPAKKGLLWTEKAYQLILKQKMKGIDKAEIKIKIQKEMDNGTGFNIYRFIKNF